MLINLSNHPSANWGTEQMQAAKAQFGLVEDLSFPNIDPTAGKAEIEELAQYYLKQIKEKAETEKLQRAQSDDGVFSGRSKVAVNLMGERTFCFALFKLLQSENIQCVVSTTERVVLEEKNGLKTARFRFVQFRDYY
ncbi:MAG: CRISPR-associated protein [Bacteroidales bacterium]